MRNPGYARFRDRFLSLNSNALARAETLTDHTRSTVMKVESVYGMVMIMNALR